MQTLSLRVSTFQTVSVISGAPSTMMRLFQASCLMIQDSRECTSSRDLIAEKDQLTFDLSCQQNLPSSCSTISNITFLIASNFISAYCRICQGFLGYLRLDILADSSSISLNSLPLHNSRIFLKDLMDCTGRFSFLCCTRCYSMHYSHRSLVHLGSWQQLRQIEPGWYRQGIYTARIALASVDWVYRLPGSLAYMVVLQDLNLGEHQSESLEDTLFFFLADFYFFFFLDFSRDRDLSLETDFQAGFSAYFLGSSMMGSSSLISPSSYISPSSSMWLLGCLNSLGMTRDLTGSVFSKMFIFNYLRVYSLSFYFSRSPYLSFSFSSSFFFFFLRSDFDRELLEDLDLDLAFSDGDESLDFLSSSVISLDLNSKQYLNMFPYEIVMFCSFKLCQILSVYYEMSYLDLELYPNCLKILNIIFFSLFWAFFKAACFYFSFYFSFYCLAAFLDFIFCLKQWQKYYL